MIRSYNATIISKVVNMSDMQQLFQSYGAQNVVCLDEIGVISFLAGDAVARRIRSFAAVLSVEENRENEAIDE